MKQTRSGPLLSMITSMVIFGTIGLFVKNIPLSSGEIALFRALLAIGVIGLFLLFRKQTVSSSDIRKALPLLLLSGMAIGANWVLLFEAYRYTSVSVATLCYYFAPVLVTVISPALFHEHTTGKQWLCFGMSTLGIILLTGLGGLSFDGGQLKGVLLALGAACFYASVILLNKRIRGISGICRTFLQFIGAVIILLPYVLLTGGFTVSGLTGSGLVLLLIVGVVHTGITYCLYFSSMASLAGQKIAILSYIDPLVAVILSVAILKEPITPLQIVGGILILGFTLWNEISG